MANFAAKLHSMALPPRPPQKNQPLTHHGHTRNDPYYWLNQRDEEEVLAYLHAENAYTETVLAPVKSLRDQLYREITGRLKEDDTSVPYRWHGYWYQSRYQKGGEYPVHVRWPDGEPDKVEVVLDENELAKKVSYCEVADWEVSPDSRWLAYTIDTQGRRLYTLHVVDLTTGALLDMAIPGTSGEIAWAADNATLFYILQEPSTLRSHQLWRVDIHAGEPALVWQEDDEAFDLTLDNTQSEQFLLCTAFSKTNTEVRYLPAFRPEGEWTPFLPRETNHEYQLDHLHGKWYILSNRDAPNFQLWSTPEKAIAPENWQLEIAHHPEQLIEDIQLFDHYLVVEVRIGGMKQLRIRSLAGGEEQTLDFEEAVYTVSIHHNPEPETPWLRFRYSSLTTPHSIYDYHMGTGEQKLRKRQPVEGDFDATRYQSKGIWATAHDGVQVPISMVYRKDQYISGKPMPVLLYGYGAYGISMDPMFNSARLSLLDRGFAFAIAHIRGGSEMGRWWYEEEGKFLHKQNTFKDFIACADHLIKSNFTTRQHLYALGGSAGGLLIGAVINQRPDLFRGVVAAVPFVDTLTTMLDPSIPLTTQEYDEWGNPEDSTYYKYILSYSPYDNIRSQSYPATLAASGYHDSQVQYWEPAKWVAKLRDHQTGTAPILLHMNFDAGHGGSSGRFKQYEEVALYYAFILGIAQGDIPD